MGLQDLPLNLRVLCSYGHSVSDICRKAKVNRQQFNKYLAGTAFPSLRNLRRICDFFGVDEYEILLEHQRFRELIRVRPPRLGLQRDPLYQFVDSLAMTGEDTGVMQRLLGYYHVYCRWDLRDDIIHCSLTRLSEYNGVFLTKNIERKNPLAERGWGPQKYRGWAVYSDDRIFIVEQQISMRRKLYSTMLYAPQSRSFRYLQGLILGIVSNATRQVACYRVVYEYLGPAPNLRNALGRCGAYRDDDETITPFIREHTRNEMRPGDRVFQPR